VAVAVVWCLLPAACGQKGPPLAPLHLVPAAVADVSLRRIGDRAQMRFVLPSRNANGPGRIELDHVEIYAITAPPGVVPPNRDLLSKAYLVGQIAVRPAPIEGEPPVEGDTRPGPGDPVTFDEELTAEKLVPVALKTGAPTVGPEPAAQAPGAPAKLIEDDDDDRPTRAGQAPVPGQPPAGGQKPAQSPESPAPGTDPASKPQVPSPDPGAKPPAAGTGSGPAAAPPSKNPVRIYVARGVTKSGRPGQPSARVQVPIVAVPPPPQQVAARFTEKAIILDWKPGADAPGASFNVYRAGEPLQPLNQAPLKEPTFEHAAEKVGEEQCYRLRSVAGTASVPIEGELSEAACVTPQDIFPPTAPKGLAAVPTPGQISLIWDANPEEDLAGYLVLRGEVGGRGLEPITPAPIRETSYTDAAVTPGTRYVYAIVAVDGASPQNSSDQSARVEETAR
jgi:hypothetical protein